MTYATLMVHLDASRSNTPVLALAARLAERCQAGVIGIAACQPAQIGTADGYFTGDLVVAERDIVDEQLQMVEAEFKAFAPLEHHITGWRSMPTLMPVSHVLALEARNADLLITSVGSANSGDGLGHADTGDLIMRAGRPVLVVPDNAATSTFETVIVAWKDTCECRRAIVDALPVLKQADRVIIVEIAEDLHDARARLNDVSAWLERHGISSERSPCHTNGDHGEYLASVAAGHGADLIVAGAYGHNRLREWAFGGVTRDLLVRHSRCALLSH